MKTIRITDEDEKKLNEILLKDGFTTHAQLISYMIDFYLIDKAKIEEKKKIDFYLINKAKIEEKKKKDALNSY